MYELFFDRKARRMYTSGIPRSVYNEDVLLDIIECDKLLETLTEKERHTIVLWVEGKTLQTIAEIISVKYEGKTKETSLSARTFGARVSKILKKLRKDFKRRENRVKSRKMRKNLSR